MTTYSVADAKNGLPKLIDRALGGEEVIISRHGKPVIELRPVSSKGRTAPVASYAWLRNRRLMREPSEMTSVDLLNQLYEEPGE